MHENPDLCIIASGSEVQLALDAASHLSEDGVNANVVSMPSLDSFLEQSADYKKSCGYPRSLFTRCFSEQACLDH